VGAHYELAAWIELICKHRNLREKFDWGQGFELGLQPTLSEAKVPSITPLVR
jgi:hypothetical protein